VRIADPIPHRPEILSLEQWWGLEVARRTKRLVRLYSIEDPTTKQKALDEDYWRCKENPAYWIQQYGWVYDPNAPAEQRDVPLVLWPDQERMVNGLLNALERSAPFLVNKSRRIGATWLAIHLIYHHWRFETMFSAKMGSRKEALVDDRTIDSLFGKFRYIHNRQPRHLRETRVDDVFLRFANQRNGSEVIGEATNEGFGRGGRRTVILLDEFAHVPPRIGVATWLSIESAWKSVWMTSTPNGKANKFYELWANSAQENLIQLNWTADPYRPDNFRERMIRPHGDLTEEEFEQEYNCSFSAIRTGRIWAIQRDCIEYDEEEEEWSRIAAIARRGWWHIGGWDFGSGPSSLVCLFAILEKIPGSSIPRIWVDDELVWRSTEWAVAANDTKMKMAEYSPSFRQHFGDPAGINRESDQQSWESNLQSAGIPLHCLDQWHNTRDGIDWQIKQVQYLFDSARLKVHTRCRALWEAIESWRYDIPDGVPLELVSKEWISPRKDELSHPANALMYLVGGIMRHFRGYREKSIGSDVPSLVGTVGEVRGMFSNAYGVRSLKPW